MQHCWTKSCHDDKNLLQILQLSMPLDMSYKPLATNHINKQCCNTFLWSLYCKMSKSNFLFLHDVELPFQF